MEICSNKPPEDQAPNRSAQNAATDVRDLQVNPANKQGPADKADISGKSREIADLVAAVNQVPDIRDAKVQEIKKSIEAGTYRVDPHKIAGKMM